MKKRGTGLLNKALALIYFIAFEVLIYYGLSWLLFDPVPRNAVNQEAIIVRNWNGFIFFFLLHAAIAITTMLVLTSVLPRQHKTQVMFFFWLSWLGLLVMLLAVFS